MATKLQVPPSSSIVNVSIIDSTARLHNLPYYVAMTPLYPGYERSSNLPCYVFLIHHPPTNTRVLYDLGLRKNFRTHLNPHLVRKMAPLGMEFSVEKDTAEILVEGGLDPGDIDTIVLSHHHFDHVGDTTKFPPTTRLVVGPGTKEKYWPAGGGYPEDLENQDSTSDTYAGREVVELAFDNDRSGDPPRGRVVCEIGGFKALDYFGDGSFYLLHTPGHTANHISALARTTAPATAGPGRDENSTFILMAGDLVHSCMSFRPSRGYPLPETIVLEPQEATISAPSSSHPPSLETEALARHHRLYRPPSSPSTSSLADARTQPFSLIPAAVEESPPLSQRNANILAEYFDADDNVLVIYAHDDSLLDGVLEFWPQSDANAWKEKGWGTKAHWRFLRRMVHALKEEEEGG
ncbi:uncharacterized protein Z520_06249 [Fonsecaea multimorphosa CBS 102226]|uniref:Metallo-beta-lactamase domain-containing protein n=1 Tax=Fonsecaea multimorphosa CBS 102226 TaxID=1442371 RepID=A0A0D2K4S3_9EURO|nr:uncharacterized protein Z520_06249 [Fonsecaea multimorphosa CBS 102226]KIX98169.1 hypothetical protein Z520_06249 [Fonsecaea multimorphosa CBS 102226]OAL24244.1 hypothetical protein AYO22_05904 [Fonsecaea multimorphosa]